MKDDNVIVNENYILEVERRYFEHSPIELLGYAKNDIVEAQNLATVPEEFSNKMRLAYQLLDEVQEYLYEN